jgi:hypothetical protein
MEGAVFGSSDHMVYFTTPAFHAPMLSEGTLFQAEIVGVLVGCGIAYAGYFYFTNWYRWSSTPDRDGLRHPS